MMTFLEWMGDGLSREWRFFLREMRGDQGYQAFVDQTNRQFRTMIGALLRLGKFTDPRNEAEARSLVADPASFNYAEELVLAAGSSRARLRGQDVLDGAQEANFQVWRKLLNPRLYEPADVTWESRNPSSVGRGGIRGTIRAWARNAAGHFAARIHKRRTGVATYQTSQIQDPDKPFEPPARLQHSELEWDDLRRAIIGELKAQLHKELRQQGPHWQSRARNLRWAAEVVRRQMATPWEWRSMPEVAAEIPELRGRLRGGLADQLKGIIDKARQKALGEDRQRALR
jgi:hypothetical protein